MLGIVPMSSGVMQVTNGTAAPGYVHSGLPFDSATLAIDVTSAVDRVVYGIPFTANGRVAFSTRDVDRYLNGLPLDADGRVVGNAGAVGHVHNGVPMSAAGGVCVSSITETEGPGAGSLTLAGYVPTLVPG